MTQNIIHKKRYITFLVALVVCMLSAIRSQAQCSWDVSAVATASTCAANGKITASLTGPDEGSLSSILYNLEPLTAGGSVVQQNPSPVFENVIPGNYRVVVEAVCSGNEVSDSYTVTVPGNYVTLTATAAPIRATLNSCNTGQALVTLTDGRLPYHITITSAPAAYTGRDTFTVNSNFIIDSLWKGNYTISITDACGAAAPTQTVTINELPVFAAYQFAIGAYGYLNSSCDRFIIYAPAMGGDEGYNNAYTPITFSVAFDGGPKLPYKSTYATRDTIVLPAGQTFKDAYGKTITFYIKSPCGEELVVNRAFYPPELNLTITANCTTDFDANFYLYNGNSPLRCYPVYTSVKNNSTNAYRYDTIQSASDNFFRTINGLPYGSYTITSTTADGHVIYQDTDWTVSAPDLSNPYTIHIFDRDGLYGNGGVAGFYIIKSTGNFSEGTTIQLTGFSNYTYSATVGASANNYFYIYNPSSPQSSYFKKGNYVFRVTDACGTYDLHVTVAEKDVYSYNWTFTTKQTCTGLEVTPSGTAMYNEASQPVYYQILSGPSGYDNTIVPQGTPLVLPLSGTYKIGISANSTQVGDYGINTQTISFTYKPLAIDVNRSLGWICPGQPANSGSITAIAINGSTAATGVYTYKLAAAAQGSTGPYLATNTTGKFSTAASGGAYTLMKDQNYDIQVVDECGAAAVQTIKIIDFATAQVATSDKPQYCLGDEIRFKVINLPTSAVIYEWKDPDGNIFSTDQNPVVKPVTATSGGTYHVKISADICNQAIEDDVIIELAPYVISCYSAVTDTSVNPYAYGLLGNWRPSRSYTYYGAREQSDPAQQTNIRKDGAFNDFMAFWKKETSGWTPQTSNPNWVWNAATIIFNKKGFELENKDPLGRYNAGLYGYDNAIPVAVIQNSRYREAAFEGFEDYGFGGNNCDEACAIGRRFYFWSTESKLDTTEKHTGRYSLRVLSSDTIGIKVAVATTANDPADPIFTEGANACLPTQVLKSVRADASVLLPSFSPLSGKKILFSAWVKEAQDCKCTAYSANQVALSITGTTNAAVIAKPVGSIIEGWQRYEQVVDLPAGTDTFSVILQATGAGVVYFDDIRIHPYNANMKSFVYDPQSLRLMAELDENNYATFYEYDDDGTLTRVKKETERGIKTIKETRSALIKETGEQELNTGN